MVCPDCKSIIPQMSSELVKKDKELNIQIYEHSCSRCECVIEVTVRKIKNGNVDKVKIFKDWQKERIT